MTNKEIKEKIDEIYNHLKKQKGDPPSWIKIPMDPPSEEVKKWWEDNFGELPER